MAWTSFSPPRLTKRAPVPQLDLGPRRHESAGLVDPLAVHEHVARQDVPGRLSRLSTEALVDEQPIDSNCALEYRFISRPL